MQERDGGRIEPDMDVCDVDGNKVGTVVRVYRYDFAAVRAADADLPPSHEEMPRREEVVEVKTGFLGLGKHLYVPMSAVQDVTPDGVFLSRREDDLDGLGWYEKPAHLDELS